MNTIEIVGNLTADPEIRYTRGGKAIANFGIASDRSRQPDSRTYYVPVSAWESLAENAMTTLRKVAFVRVRGALRVDAYEAADGGKRTSFEFDRARDRTRREECGGRVGRPTPSPGPQRLRNSGTFFRTRGWVPLHLLREHAPALRIAFRCETMAMTDECRLRFFLTGAKKRTSLTPFKTTGSVIESVTQMTITDTYPLPKRRRIYD